MRFSALLLHALICVILPFATAIYEDEAYRIDYQHALLGVPRRDNTFFHQPTANSKASLLYTLSEKLVIGAVNPKDGSIVWRQDLAEGRIDRASIQGFLRAANEMNLVISAAGNSVKAWEGANGRLVWEWEGEGTLLDLYLIDIAGGSKDPIVLMDENGIVRISRLSSTNGKMIWKVEEEMYVCVYPSNAISCKLSKLTYPGATNLSPSPPQAPVCSTFHFHRLSLKGIRSK